MAEEQTPQEPEATPPPAENQEDEQTQALLDEAKATAVRIENANAETARLLKQQQALQVEKTFAGSANAGSQSLSKDEQEIADSKKLLAGTGLEDYAFPSK